MTTEQKRRGRKPKFGTALSDTERNRRVRQRRKIMRDTAREFGLASVSVYLPERIAQLINEQASGQASADQITFAVLCEWIESQAAAMADHAKLIEQATTMAAERINAEGLA